MFFSNSCFFDDPTDVGNLISDFSTFSKSSLNIWKFMVHILLKLVLENFEHYLASMWDECNCVVVWTFFGIAFLRDWSKNWPFPVLWPLLSFPDLQAYHCEYYLLTGPFLLHTAGSFAVFKKCYYMIALWYIYWLIFAWNSPFSDMITTPFSLHLLYMSLPFLVFIALVCFFLILVMFFIKIHITGLCL